MLRRLLFCVSVVALALFESVNAQLPHNYHFTHLKSADGLPHQQVEAMAFDSMGRLWVGTRNGLACYDGYSFKTYYCNPLDSTSLPYNFVTRLLVSSDNTLWIGSERGICRFRPETDNFKQYKEMTRRVGQIVESKDGKIFCCGDRIMEYDPSTDSFKNVPVQSENYTLGATISPDNRLYISSNFDISMIDPSSGRQTLLDPEIYSDFLNGIDCIAPLYFDRNGLLWIGRNGKGVMSMDLATGERKIYDVPKLTDGTVRVISEDKNGLIWVGTEDGLNVINPADGRVNGVRQDLVNSNHLNDNAIYCIESDAAGNMWIGTYFGGINLMKNSYSDFRWIQPGYDNFSLRGKAIRRLTEPEEGKLWLASEDGGIIIMDLRSGRISTFDRFEDIGSNVHELYYDQKEEEIWIGTFRNGLFRYNIKSGRIKGYKNRDNCGLPSDAVFCIARQSLPSGEERLWVATTAGLRYYDPSSDSFKPTNYAILDRDFVYTVLADHKGNLWVGTVNNGLMRMDVLTGEVMMWNNMATENRPSLNDHYVTSLFEDSSGRVFIGTNTGGLHYIHTDSLALHSFPAGARRFGTVCMITQDRAGDLWVSTSSGLFRLDPDNLGIRHFTVADGLPENQFNFASALQGSDGRMYFGTVNGLVSFLPEAVRTSEPPREVHLWRLVINNREIAPSAESVLSNPLDNLSEIELDYDMSRTFSIDYGIVQPGGATGISYQVWLKEIDHGWRDVGPLRQFTAMELAPGTYHLRLRASPDSDGWNDAPVRELVIKIAPPWYLTVWAFLAYTLLVILIGAVIWHFMQLRIKEKNAIRISRLEKEKSEELNREKMEFFTNISHELKTPLSLILAPLKYISQHQSLSEDSTKRLGVAIANTNKMVGLIDELVTFNRVESGNFQLYLQKSNPLTFIETMCGYFLGAAQEKQIALRVYTENNGEEVWFSTTYLERILYNLLSNAVKYTHEGGQIDVRASIEEGEDEDIYLTLEVRDNGIGIAPEEVDNIFKKYYQTKRGYNTNHQGWGIGLATVRRLVEIHKGNIKVNSTMGVGSAFTVRLNVSPDRFDPKWRIESTGAAIPEPTYRRTINSALTSRPVNTDNIREACARVSILIVEDNPELLSFLSESFGKSYNVYTATNGQEALKIASDHQIDIVVSDVMMPEMDGITLCEHLKNDLATSHIPVILLTAKNDEVSIMKGFEAGAEAYVAKPFDPQILELRVKNILRARSKFLNSIINPTPEETPAREGEREEEEESDSEISPVLNKFDKDFINHMNEFVEANLDNSEFSIAAITREFAISRSLLHIKMKSLFNTSMTDFIRRKRMLLASQLLKSGLNVSETAYRVGFSDPNYFTKVFKKEFGTTPSEFIAS